MPPKHFLTSNFRVAFEEYFDPGQQRSAVDTLRGHIAEVRDGSEEQRRELGVLKPQDKTPEQIEQRVAAYLDKCYWQLAQFYRYSVPCRIDEAEPYLREIIRYAKLKGGKRDVAPELYLAVAIHKAAEKEQEAISLFTEAFNSLDMDGASALGPRSDLWARAHWARLLRRVERVQEAQVQEQVIVDWIVDHPLLLPPPKLKALVSDEADSGVLNNILDHPQVVAAIQSAKEKRSGVVVA
ncbi:hypothetical protein BN946_scf184970.g38 [Trametes cinnabarina]|uniref:Uncharacterized protein n=1 Tax=Pycnoporus cinnabarinus TaxID=5643 RepID=A0A060SD73_PYCCI|nr:hypothetical protein BN946_scf184970.g38 [Trametes cinnabarina]